MAELFSTEELRAIDEIKSHYPEAKAALMPVLWMAQNRHGWISQETMQGVALLLGLPVAHVLGVVTFYTMYFTKPMGKHHVQVCTNVSCMLRGGEKIYERVAQELGIGHRQRTDDGKFSLEEVECMGACGGAPMVAINEDFHENISAEQVLDMLKKL
jgi:NADH-quinone oxidoreductase E subunit